MSQPPLVRGLFDAATGTITYVVVDPQTRRAAVIDPVMDFDYKSGATDVRSLRRVLDCLRHEDSRLEWILETHAHADHLSGAQWLKEQAGGRIAIGEYIRDVQRTFKPLLGMDERFRIDGSQFDHLFKDGESFRIGNLEAQALFVPGHTPADLAYLVGDAVFVGDTLFMPDVGTARADFPGGDARTLFQSVRRLLQLPSATRMFVCHDYPPAGREALWETTVAEQRAHNIHVHDGVTSDEFVAMRMARDATLAVPNLILPSIQVNVDAGRLPLPQADGVSYLKIPLNRLPRKVEAIQ